MRAEVARWWACRSGEFSTDPSNWDQAEVRLATADERPAGKLGARAREVIACRVEDFSRSPLVPVRKQAREEVRPMARNSKQTGAAAAKAASKTLASKTASKAAKTAAGSALSQTPKRGR